MRHLPYIFHILLNKIKMSQQIKSLLRKARSLHLELNLQADEANKYLQFIKLTACEKPKFAPCGGCLSQKIDVKPSLLRALSTLNQREKAEFYLKNVLKAKEVLQGNISQRSRIFKDENLTTSWYFFNESQRQWQTKSIQVNFKKLTLKFRSTKEEIDLHNYILRASKKKDKERKVLALESIQTLQLPQTIRLSNNRQDFQSFCQLLTNIFDEALKDNLSRMLSMDSKSGFRSGFRLHKNVDEEPIIQNKTLKKHSFKNLDESLFGGKQNGRKSLGQSNNIKKSDQYQNLKSKLMTFLLFEQNFETYRQNVLINEKENRVRKTYQYPQDNCLFSFQWFTTNFMNSSTFRRWKKTLLQSRTLSLNHQTVNQIFYQQHQYKDKTKVSYIYRREKVKNQQDCLYFIDTPVDETNYQPVEGKIQYVIWKVQKIQQKLIITCQGKMERGNLQSGLPSIKLTDQFLGDMDCICMNLNVVLQNQTDLNVNSIQFEEQYLSRIQSFNDEDQYITIQDTPHQESLQSLRNMIQKISEPSYNVLPAELTSTNYLKYRHPQVPFKKQKPIYKYPNKQGQHPYFENEFRFTKEGEMVSINQAKLKAQSSVLKDLLKSISKNLFSGKSVLSISLPVTVFSVQSNLSLICKSYAYAPLLLEKAVAETDPVQRMKFVAAFSVTIVVAYLQMDKPFNPILGETFQTIVDGCLVYGQQVSHHPPISSTFMVGRGYRLYGSFEAKVNFGVNSASGSNQGVLHISFDSKDYRKKLYKILFPPGQVTGLTFGERKVATIGKAYILDTENMLYLELNYNRHKGVSEYCKFYDGIQGKIVQLAPNTDISKLQKINKKSFTKEYGMLNGRWTGEVYYENQLIFNSWEDLPYENQQYPCPLQSHAYYREDLQYRVKNDYQTAQTQKQRLEDIQRKDRALRKKYTGKQHS